MLRVKTRQMGALRGQLAERRVLRLAAHLREQHASLVEHLTDDSLVARVREGVARAGSYGISWDKSLAIYLIIMIRVSPRFDEHPYIRQILTDQRVEPDHRVYSLLHQVTESDWEDVIDHGRHA